MIYRTEYYIETHYRNKCWGINNADKKIFITHKVISYYFFGILIYRNKILNH